MGGFPISLKGAKGGWISSSFCPEPLVNTRSQTPSETKSLKPSLKAWETSGPPNLGPRAPTGWQRLTQKASTEATLKIGDPQRVSSFRGTAKKVIFTFPFSFPLKPPKWGTLTEKTHPNGFWCYTHDPLVLGGSVHLCLSRRHIRVANVVGSLWQTLCSSW